MTAMLLLSAGLGTVAAYASAPLYKSVRPGVPIDQGRV